MLIGTCFQRFTLRGFLSGHVFDPLCDSGKALSCCTIQELVGCSVTLNWRILESTVFDHEKTMQDSEPKSWYGEEVHGRNGLAVIAEESSPESPCLVGRFGDTHP